MKKLFYLFMVAMCATMFSACSDDDDKDPLDDDGEGKEGVITMVVDPTNYYGDWGLLETFNEGEIITIDWGDGNVEEFKSFEYYADWDEDGEDEIYYVIGNKDEGDEYNNDQTSIHHKYSDNKLYTITIKGKIKALFTGDGDYLSSLNVSGCPALTELVCCYTKLTSLDVSKNTALTVLGCWGNDLTSLDVSNNTKLTELSCYNNNLTSLDVSKNTALTDLDCGDNNLTALDVSKNTALTELYCGGTNLTSLDVSKNTALTELWCSGNNLTSLDVSKNTALTKLVCKWNDLTSAALNQIFRDLPQGKKSEDYPYHSTIEIGGNPGTETCDKSIAENKGWYVFN